MSAGPPVLEYRIICSLDFSDPAGSLQKLDVRLVDYGYSAAVTRSPRKKVLMQIKKNMSAEREAPNIALQPVRDGKIFRKKLYHELGDYQRFI